MSNSQFCEITLVLISRFWKGFDSRICVGFVKVLIQGFVLTLWGFWFKTLLWCYKNLVSFTFDVHSYTFFLQSSSFFASRTFQVICHFFVLILYNLISFCSPSWWGHCNLCCWFISYKFYYKFGNVWPCVMKFNLMKIFNFTLQRTKLSSRPCWIPWCFIHINFLLLLICCLIRILGTKWKKVYNMVFLIFDKSI